MDMVEVRATYETVKNSPTHWSVYQRIKRLCEYILKEELHEKEMADESG